MKPSPASTKAPLPWISPLHYRSPTRAAPPSPPPPPPPLPEAPLTQLLYVHHPDLARLIASSPSAQRALDLFNAAAAQRGFTHTQATFAALLVRLARSRLTTAEDAVLRRTGFLD